MSVDEVVQRFGSLPLTATGVASRHYDGVVWQATKDTLVVTAEGLTERSCFTGVTLAQAILLDNPWVEVREATGGSHWCGRPLEEVSDA